MSWARRLFTACALVGLGAATGVVLAAGLTGAIVAIVVGARRDRVDDAELGLSEGFVGLTIVAMGTSLPELVTSVQAMRSRVGSWRCAVVSPGRRAWPCSSPTWRRPPLVAAG